MGDPALTDCTSCCVESPSWVAARSYSPVRSHSMTLGSSEFREKLAPSAANLWYTVCGERTVQPRANCTHSELDYISSYPVAVIDE